MFLPHNNLPVKLYLSFLQVQGDRLAPPRADLEALRGRHHGGDLGLQRRVRHAGPRILHYVSTVRDG